MPGLALGPTMSFSQTMRPLSMRGFQSLRVARVGVVGDLLYHAAQHVVEVDVVIATGAATLIDDLGAVSTKGCSSCRAGLSGIWELVLVAML